VTEGSTAAPENRLPVEKVGLDELTGVWNRAGFIAAATPMLIVCQRRGAPCTLGYFDIHSTRLIQSADDTAMLNGVVKAVAQQMGKMFRSCDVIGRIDPLRFAVLFADCTDDALSAIEGVRAVTDESTPANSNVLTTAVVEAAPETTFVDLMQQADLRVDELRKRDVDATRHEDPDWSLVPAKVLRPAKRRAKTRR
jgi:GGDEF domain-containing protein